MRESDADFLAELLLNNDVRCVYSHGSQQLPDYMKNLNGGGINPEPNVKVTANFAATAVVYGDGGLGYIACRDGMELVLKKTKEFGMGAVATGNHHHFGSASHWTRMAVGEGFIGMAMSSHRRELDGSGMVLDLVMSSPLSIAFPAGDQPPFILDMGGGILPKREDLMEAVPNSFFKGLGISAAIQMFGGVLAGINRPQEKSDHIPWISNQGSFLCAFDVKRFMDAGEFAEEIDRFIATVRAMEPFPGLDRAELPGGMEWQWERDNHARGAFSMGDGHRENLEELAAGVGGECSYEAFEGTRF